MIHEIKPLVEQTARHGKSLVNQIRRSASSVPLNVAEGLYSRGGNQLARFQDAMGSADETRAALKVALAWGYIAPGNAQSVDQKLDRVVALLWGLARKPRRQT